MEREQLIRKYILSYIDLETGKAKDETSFNELKKTLNECSDEQFFGRKKAETNTVINRIISIFSKNGDLVSKSQSMTLHHFILTKIWSDIYLAAIKEAGYGQSDIYIYRDFASAADDKTNSQVVINFLKDLAEQINAETTFADFILTLSKNQTSFFNLDI